MRLQHVAQHIFYEPWLITDAAHASIVRLFESKSDSSVAFATDEDNASAFFVQRQPASLDVNGIGHVHIKGTTGLGLAPITKSCGCTDTQDVQGELLALVAQGAKGILLHIDSPGGMVTGTKELSDTVENIAQEIPVYVFTDSQMCSAAYWIACSATKIVSTETAIVGSIGVFIPWVDRSAQWEEEGISWEPITNSQGTYKTGFSGPSLSDVQRAQAQQHVDRIFSLFRGDVITQRALHEAVVPDSAMQGQVFLGVDAVENGLVDVLGDKQDAYEMLLGDTEFDPAEVSQPADDASSDSTEDAGVDVSTTPQQ